MNYRMLSYLLSIVMLIEAALLLIPAAVALIYGESVFPFILTVAILIAIAAPFSRRPENTRIYAKDGFICVTGAWIILSIFGALPFVISQSIPNYIDALFETVSGLSTTGASILTDIESLPKGILLWRSLTHWIGGMGVLVFMLAILPSLGGNSIHLMRAEVPGPTKGKVVPKMRTTALLLYGIYIALTIIMIIALLFTGMSLYDSVVNALGTAGTGGFSVKNASIAGYNNPAAEWVIAAFMFLFGVNFNLYFFILIGRAKEIFKNEEFRTYVLIILGSITLIAINTCNMFDNIGECLRTTVFQVTSIISTTGFSTADFDKWPALSKAIILILTMTGACAGSTAGGLKLSRIIIIFKNTVKEIRHMLRPNSVNVVRLDKEAVREETIKAAANYLSIYVILNIVSFLLISINGLDVVTNATATLTCINNVGPGLNLVGPTGNFSVFSGFSKFVLILDMLFGRLEIMPMLILFSPKAWKNR